MTSLQGIRRGEAKMVSAATAIQRASTAGFGSARLEAPVAVAKAAEAKGAEPTERGSDAGIIRPLVAMTEARVAIESNLRVAHVSDAMMRAAIEIADPNRG